MIKPWNEMTKVEQLCCEYSDFYKEEHGSRPIPNEHWNSEEWLTKQIRQLAKDWVLKPTGLLIRSNK